jgi:hypothetical protein
MWMLVIGWTKYSIRLHTYFTYKGCISVILQKESLVKCCYDKPKSEYQQVSQQVCLKLNIQTLILPCDLQSAILKDKVHRSGI